MLPTLTGAALCLCLTTSACFAQSSAGGEVSGQKAGDQIVCTSRYLEQLQRATGDIQQQLCKKTIRCITRIQQRELKLQRRLYAIDSVKTRAIFANAEGRYTTYLQQLKGNPLTKYSTRYQDYLPGLDSLSTGIAFLQRHPELMSKDLAHGVGLSYEGDALSGAADNLRQLQARFGQLGDIQEYIHGREVLLKEQLSEYGLGKQLLALNKEAYYYQQQIEQYKAAWKDPSKVREKLMAAIRPLPAFQSFFRQHSWLSQLFPAPAGLGTTQPLAGLQSRAELQQLLQRTAAGMGPGTDPGQYVQQQVQAAQDGLDKLKSKVSELGGTGGSGDMVLPDFKPDHQKNKTFLQRLEYSFNIQTSAATTVLPAISDIGLGVGYRLSDQATAGVGLSYKLGLGRGFDHIAFSSEGIGIRSYTEVNAKGSLWVTCGLEYNYLQEFSKLSDVRDLTVWQRSILAGLTKKITLGKTRQCNIQLLYDVLAGDKPGSQRFKFRTGWGFH